ncbi:kinase-like domain-containing protein [Aspergillus welwitschiae]|uniref:Kinase-like domain-containing protein n=1 Tax=Aspergillus welwitschiae TaxID=1341132 RepID=A0A3F3PV78_9EURO|nr:kinase-like domain-containing protein [Aspergillus welwitschiae]RDH30837.1 kinase-like domain-containing protein [Aspergillus welwitschiae]
MQFECEGQWIGPFEVIKWPNVPGARGLARNRITGENAVLKAGWIGSLNHEAHTLLAASGGIGIPLLHWFETVNGMDVMITDTYGPSLEENFCLYGRYFSMQRLLLFADQILSRIEFLHSRRLVHGNLSPWSFALGEHAWQNQQVLLVDFDIEAGVDVSPAGDIHAIGLILAYFYSGCDSWVDYQQRGIRENPKDTAPVFSSFLNAISTCKTVDYDSLREIFRGAYLDFATQLAIALDLRGPRAIREGYQSVSGCLITLTTPDLFEKLHSKLIETGNVLTDEDISPHWGRQLLLSLEEIMNIYILLISRDRPSCDQGRLKIAAYHLPNRLWRDLRWFLAKIHHATKEVKLAFIEKIYSFVAALKKTQFIWAWGISLDSNSVLLAGQAA